MASVVSHHLQNLLSVSIKHTESHSAVVVFDEQSELSRILSGAYRQCLPNAQFIHFDTTPAEHILKILLSLKPSDLAVLIQSDSFRLGAFRIRVDLFARGIKVIEHPHLGAMQPDEIPIYLDSLEYDADYFRSTGPALKKIVDTARCAVLDSGGNELIFESGFEDAKLNIGDYTQTKNVGGQFPIGEVFTEAKNLEAVNGRVQIFAFGDTAFRVNKPDKPITLAVRHGKVTEALSSTPEFDKVLSHIRADEDDVWVRELGFGLNRAMTRNRLVSDIGTYERMCGVHLSLGAKHTIYKKPNFTRKQARHHVDVFAVTESVLLDDKIVFKNNAWQA